ncbi:hypothetical protein V6Z12_D07G199000 [Gossypium hirsutum]
MRPKNNLKIVEQKKKKNEENNILSLPFVWSVGKCETKRKSTKQNPKLSTTFFLHFPLDFTTPDEGKITPEVNESIASLLLPLEQIPIPTSLTLTKIQYLSGFRFQQMRRRIPIPHTATLIKEDESSLVPPF